MHSERIDARTEGCGFEIRGQYLLSGVGVVFSLLKSNSNEQTFHPFLAS